MRRATQDIRRSFTLVELLISVTIVAVLASSALFTLYTALEQAREARTRTQIAKIHELIMERIDNYETRPLRLAAAAGMTPRQALQLRLLALRETMRIELPDRITDLAYPVAPTSPTKYLASTPSLRTAYRRAVDGAMKNTSWYLSPQTPSSIPAGKWTFRFQGAECLYLILGQVRDGDQTALEYFLDSEVGDTDLDGMPEILDGWGRPIEFLRWAPGFVTGPGPDGQWGKAGVDDNGNSAIDDEGEAGTQGSDDASDVQSRDAVAARDPYDPFRVDDRDTYALVPLIYSAGRDGRYGIQSEIDMIEDSPPPATSDDQVWNLFNYYDQNNDPYYYFHPGAGKEAHFLGTPDIAAAADNITNHTLDTK